jgi:hypothetical protein
MSAMTLLILIKIGATIILVAGPFLLLPRPKLEAMTGSTVTSDALFRLYGIAMTALLIGYGSGLWQIQQGIFPWGIVLMGLVSNGGAAFTVARLGSRSSRRLFVPVFGGIAVGLALCAAFPDAAIAPLF